MSGNSAKRLIKWHTGWLGEKAANGDLVGDWVFEHIFLKLVCFLWNSGLFPSNFCTFIVEFCRDRRLRAFSKNFKILASSLFSFPCLSQILSSSPGTNHLESFLLLLIPRILQTSSTSLLMREWRQYLGARGRSVSGWQSISRSISST